MWRLAGTTAHWESARFQTRVDLASPERGMASLAYEGMALPNVSLMQMHLPPNAECCSIQLEDCYVREADLIARYADTTRQVMLPEFSWRITDDTALCDGAIIESLVSVHTQLLDSDPQVTVQCEMPAEGYRVWQAADEMDFSLRGVEEGGRVPIEFSASGCLVVWQSTVHPLVFGQVVPAADISRAEIICDAASQLITSRICYFRGRLEKGVIRRARLRGVLTRGHGALHVLAEQWQDLLSAPPPLAT